MGLSGQYLIVRRLGRGLEIEIVVAGFLGSVRLGLIGVEASHIEPRLLLELMDGRLADCLQLNSVLATARSRYWVFNALSRPALAISNRAPPMKTEYCYCTKQDHEDVPLDLPHAARIVVNAS